MMITYLCLSLILMIMIKEYVDDKKYWGSLRYQSICMNVSTEGQKVFAYNFRVPKRIISSSPFSHRVLHVVHYSVRLHDTYVYIPYRQYSDHYENYSARIPENTVVDKT